MAINLPGAIKAGGSGKMWDENTGPLIGKYVARRSDVGPNGSMVYTLKPDDGEEIGVWGSAVIDARFKEIPINSTVGIEYIGKVQAKRGSGQYKDYDIQYIPPEGYQPPAMPEMTTPAPKSDDVVIQDLDASQNINLDDIPF